MEPNTTSNKKSMEYDYHKFSECLAFQIENLVFQSKYLVFSWKYLVFRIKNFEILGFSHLKF